MVTRKKMSACNNDEVYFSNTCTLWRTSTIWYTGYFRKLCKANAQKMKAKIRPVISGGSLVQDIQFAM